MAASGSRPPARQEFVMFGSFTSQSKAKEVKSSACTKEQFKHLAEYNECTAKITVLSSLGGDITFCKGYLFGCKL